MANIYNNAKVDLTTTDNTTIYTTPSDSRAIIKNILVSDDSGSGDSINVTSPTGITEGYRGPDPTGRTGPDGLGDFIYEPSAFQKAKDFYSKLPTPFNLAKKFVSGIGNLLNLGEVNRNFYENKVVPAGRTNLSYEDYMKERLAGNIDAYGNKINRSDNERGVMQVSQVLPIEDDEQDNEENQYDFNYGTASNPIYYSDLV